MKLFKFRTIKYKYIIWLLLSSIISFMKPVYSAYELPPSQFGVLSFFIISSSLIVYIVGCSIDMVLLRKLTYYESSKSSKMVNIIFSNSFFLSFIICSFVSIILYVISLFYNLSYIYVTIPFLGFLIYIFNMSLVPFRASGDFLLLSKFIFLRVIISFVFYIIFPSLMGFIFAEIFSYVVVIYFSLKNFNISFLFLNFRVIVKLFKLGSFFSCALIIQYLSMNFDRWLGLRMLPEEMYGIYSFSFIIVSVFLVIANIINQPLTPYLFSKKKDMDNDSYFVFLLKISVALFFLYMLISLMLYFLLEIIITSLYFDYISVFDIYIYINIGVIFHVINIVDNYYIVNDRGVHLFIVRLISFSITILASVIIYYSFDSTISFVSLSIIFFISRGSSLFLMIFLRNIRYELFSGCNYVFK